MKNFAITFSLCYAMVTWPANVKATLLRPRNMTILVMLPDSGRITSPFCRAAMSVAVEATNNRSDILKGYHLKVQSEDETTAGRMATRRLIDFVRQRDADPAELRSPLVVGPLFSDGCKQTGRVAHHVGTIEIGVGCAAPVFTANRRMFPNFYRTKPPADNVPYGRLLFLKDIGKWKKIAIVSTVENSYSLALAQSTEVVAQKNNMEVVYFQILPELAFEPRSFAELKASDARIIVVDLNLSTVFRKFLCTAYIAGIYGSRYVFIAQGGVYPNPEGTPDPIMPRCTRENLKSQLERTFFIGHVREAYKNSGFTPLGYDLVGFERRLTAKVGKARGKDFVRRHMCHDPMLHAVLALDAAEKTLQGKNMSLADYHRFPETVLDAVNSSVAKASFVGTRNGHLQYSKRLEIDNEDQIIRRWTREKGLETSFVVIRNETGELDEPSSYSLQVYAELQWPTSDGKPPRDEPIRKQEQLRFPVSAAVAALVLSSFATAVEIFVAVRIAKRQVQKHMPFGLGRIFVIFGCLLVNLSAVSTALTAFSQYNTLCELRTIFLSIGVSMISGGFFGWLSVPLKGTIVTVRRPNSKSPRVKIKRTALTSRKWADRRTYQDAISWELTFAHWYHNDLFIAAWGLAVTGVVGFLLAVWYVLSPQHVGLQYHQKAAEYLPEVDTWLQRAYVACGVDAKFAAAITGVNVLVLLFAIFRGYLRSKTTAKKAIGDLLRITYGSINSLAVILLAVAVSVLLQSPADVDTAVSFVSLLLSMATVGFASRRVA